MQELMGIRRFCKQIRYKFVTLFDDLNIKKINLFCRPFVIILPGALGPKHLIKLTQASENLHNHFINNFVQTLSCSQFLSRIV